MKKKSFLVPTNFNPSTCVLFSMFGVQFLCPTFSVGVGGTILCVFFLNANPIIFTSLDITCNIFYCVQFIFVFICSKYSNYLSCGHAWFFSIWMFNSCILLINSTRITFHFFVTSIRFLWIVDVVFFILLFPTWCQDCLVSYLDLFSWYFLCLYVVKKCQDQIFLEFGLVMHMDLR